MTSFRVTSILGEGAVGKPKAKRLEPRLRHRHEHPLGRGRKSRPGFFGVTGSLKRSANVSEHSAEEFWIEVPKLVE